MTPRQLKRKEREPKSSHLYEKEAKYQYPIEEFEVRCSADKSAKVWGYFGDLYHQNQLVCDRVYCRVCFEHYKKVSTIDCLLASLISKIKHYAKSVSTGNLAIHLNDKHDIAFAQGVNGSPGRPPKSRKGMASIVTHLGSPFHFYPTVSRMFKSSDNENENDHENTTTDAEDHSTPVGSNFANNSIDSSGKLMH